jgi:threonine-phosphate decarboxylase
MDLSVNVNPLGPPEVVLDAWPAFSQEISRYPSLDGEGIKTFYWERFGLPGESVLPGNGSIELIYLVPRAFKIRRAAVLQPCFHDYAQALLLCGSEVLPLELSAKGSFKPPTAGEWRRCMAGVDAVYIGNPNNPTGTFIPRENLLELARQYPDTLFLVDEAFVQFLDDFDQVSLLYEQLLRPNLLVFHSLTKFYCLPGLRLGALVGDPKTIARVRPFKEPWTVNAVAERVSGILAGCLRYEQRTRKLISTERNKILSGLAGIPGIRTFPATANFFLAQWTATRDLDDLLRFLLAEGIHVRDCRNFPGLEDNFFRFAVRTAPENNRFLHALARIVRGAYG